MGCVRRHEAMKVFYHNLALSLAPIAVAILLTFAAMTAFRRGQLIRFAETQARQEVTLASHLLESYFERHLTLAESVASSPAARASDLESLLPYMMREQDRLSGSVSGLFWNDLEGNVTAADGTTFRVADRPYFQRIREGTSVITGRLDSRAGEGPIVLLLAPVISDEGRLRGAIGLTLPVGVVLAEARRRAARQITAVLIDSDGHVIGVEEDGGTWAHPGVFAGLADGGVVTDTEGTPHHVFRSTLPSAGWTLAHVYPREILRTQVRAARFMHVIVLAGAALAGLGTAGVATYLLSRRMRNLVEAIRRYGDGQRAVRAEVSGPGEIAEIAHAFNQMAETIEQRDKVAAKAMAERERNRTLLDAVLANTSAVVYVKDLEGRYVLVNDGHARLLDASRAEILGRKDRDILPGSIAAQLERNDAEALARGTPTQFEERVILRGEERALLSTKFPVRNGSGEVIGLGVVSADMTARDRAERALRDRERVYRTVTDFVPVGIYQADEQGRCTFVSRRWCELAGMSEAQAAGDGWIATIHPEDRARIAELWERFISGEADFRAEYRFRPPGGRVIEVEGLATSIRDSEGNVTGFFGVVMDITERKRLRHQIEHAQRMDSIGRLAGGIAHDFNNLTTAILGYADMARTEAGQGRDPGSALEAITIAAHRAADLTGQLLAFARRRIVEPRTFSLAGLLGELQILTLRLLPENIVFELDAPKDLWPISADPSQIQQVLINLVVNARDAMPSGGTLRVTATNQTASIRRDSPARDMVRIEVIDSGVGIRGEMLDQIFEPFVTTKRPGAGTGLGLSTAHGIVSQAGGEIRVESEPGKGSRFTVLLPRSRAPVSEDPKRGGRGEVRGEEHVLLIEDDERVLDVTRAGLRMLGYRVTAHLRAVAALAEFRESPGAFDVLVSDVMMPEMTGDQLVEAARMVRRDIPVVLTSGYSETDLAGERGRGTRFVPKPYTPEELAAAIRGVVARGRATGKNEKGPGASRAP